jgi:hypothetical protein
MTPDLFLNPMPAAGGRIAHGRNRPLFTHISWILSVALCPAVSPRNAVLAAGMTISLESLTDEMTNRDQLAKSPAPDFRLKQASSYDMEYAVATYWYGSASSYANGIRDAAVAAQLPARLNDPHSK